MKRFSKNIIGLLAVGLLSVAFCNEQAQARPIEGSIDFGGVVTFDTMSLATAKQVNVWNSSFVLQDSGDFASINPGTSVTMAAPWKFNPSTATPGLWNVGGFQFDLTSAIVVSQSANFLNVTGIGTISSTIPGLDPTPGTWSFTASNANGSDNATFGFQSQTAPQAVPEASSLFLLLIGFSVAGALKILRQAGQIRI